MKKAHAIPCVTIGCLDKSTGGVGEQAVENGFQARYARRDDGQVERDLDPDGRHDSVPRRIRLILYYPR